MDEYQLLVVTRSADSLLAVFPNQQFMGPVDREQLTSDFRLLCTAGVSTIQLDLRAIEFIDGHFPGMLLELSRNLEAAGGRLTVNVSPNLAEVLRVTKLDQVFDLE